MTGWFAPLRPIPNGGVAGTPRRSRTWLGWVPWALASVLAVAGCDAGGVPTALVVAAESEAALQIAEELPTLPWFSERVDARLDSSSRRVLAIGISLWEESLDASSPAPEHDLRETVYDVVAPILAGRLAPGDLEAAHAALSAWLRMATAVVAEARIDALDARLAEGRRLTNELVSAASDEEPDTERALLAALRAADVLLETTPRVIALRLTAWGEGRLVERTAGDDAGTGPIDSLALSRADRLLRGAREAIAQRDYPLAIRRAFYARQLLAPTCGMTC